MKQHFESRPVDVNGGLTTLKNNNNMLSIFDLIFLAEIHNYLYALVVKGRYSHFCGISIDSRDVGLGWPVDRFKVVSNLPGPP